MSALDGLIVTGMVLQNAGAECLRLRRESELLMRFHTTAVLPIVVLFLKNHGHGSEGARGSASALEIEGSVVFKPIVATRATDVSPTPTALNEEYGFQANVAASVLDPDW